MKFVYSLLIPLILLACKEQSFKPGTFGYDMEILKNVEGIEVLQDGNSMIALSGVYQGRVFTTSSKGMNGRSYGWLRKDAVEAGNSDVVMSSIGGEGRMIFGPEAGKYSIFFDPGDDQVPENIKISPDLNNKKFILIEKGENSVVYGSDLKIRNANGYVFDIYAKRKIELIKRSAIESQFDLSLPDEVSIVAFSASSEIENIGSEQWSKENGLLAIWDLGCMLPSSECKVIIPLSQPTDSLTEYFTSTEGRYLIQNDVAFYKSDAAYMNKIGLPPEYCKNVMGSYSPELDLLNIVHFSFDNDSTSTYVNSVWGHSNPYKGDVINIFNGEVNVALDRNWPFFEFESSSSARELKPEEKMKHMQSIYHFEGDKEDLSKISKAILGISLDEVPEF
ncbi:MAG: hypothetical protein JXQ96_17860 [Cyclobacteriaceae bacterium]